MVKMFPGVESMIKPRSALEIVIKNLGWDIDEWLFPVGAENIQPANPMMPMPNAMPEAMPNA
jgi:hypothetical protein